MSKQTLALVKWGLRMVAWAFGVVVAVLVGLHLVSGLIALIGGSRMSLFDFGDFLAGEVYGAWNMAVLIFALCFRIRSLSGVCSTILPGAILGWLIPACSWC